MRTNLGSGVAAFSVRATSSPSSRRSRRFSARTTSKTGRSTARPFPQPSRRRRYPYFQRGLGLCHRFRTHNHNHGHSYSHSHSHSHSRPRSMQTPCASPRTAARLLLTTRRVRGPNLRSINLCPIASSGSITRLCRPRV